MPVPSIQVPDEIWSLVFSKLSPRYLVVVLCVSSQWKSLALPRLYHVVRICRLSDLLRLQQRLSDDEVARSSLRSLTIDRANTDRKSSQAIYEEHLEHVQSILKLTTQLEHFDWDIDYCEGGLLSVSWLHTYHSNLQSFSATIGVTYFDYKSFFTQLSNFRNMKYFSLKMANVMDDPTHKFVDSLAECLRGWPDIQVFDIFYQINLSGGLILSLNDFCANLDDVNFRSLHTFRFVGDVHPDWAQFFESPNENKVRHFFVRHPNLRRVGLGCVNHSTYDETVHPTDIASVFPSVTHLEVPVYVGMVVMSSPVLSTRLVSLSLINNPYPGTDNEIKLDIGLGPVRSMPNLRSFGLFLGPGHPSWERFEGLDEVLRNAPMLEEFAFGILAKTFDELFEVLRLTPNIRTLGVKAIQFRCWTDEWHGQLLQIFKICPRLQYVNSLGTKQGYNWVLEPRDRILNVTDGTRPVPWDLDTFPDIVTVL